MSRNQMHKVLSSTSLVSISLILAALSKEQKTREHWAGYYLRHAALPEVQLAPSGIPKLHPIELRMYQLLKNGLCGTS
eukprot:5073005-Amphidinium_carterae.2